MRKVKKRLKMSKFEKLIYTLALFLLVISPVSIVFSKATLANINYEVEKQKKHFQSVRFKLFLTMCVTITIIVLCLVIINSVVLGSFYMYSKTRTVRNVYNRINAILLNSSSILLSFPLLL